MGADGAPSLAPAARAAVEGAELVAGSRRQLQLIEPLRSGLTLVWPSPLAEGIAQVLARRGRPTCVLASGDPFFYGIGATLAPALVRGEYVCYPAPSSVSLAAACLGWPLHDTDVVSLHGRDLELAIRYLQPNRRLLALSWDRHTPQALAQLLTQRGFGESRMHVLESLGSRAERVRTCRAEAFDITEIEDLNLVALELTRRTGALVIPYRASLPDAAFEHDGQLTKQDVRAVTLSALAPAAGARLWDVGAGAGSIAIEWLLSHPACRASAIEQDPVRCERIRRNARALGVPGLEVVHARAPAGLSDLASPDAVFIGGGGADVALFESCWRALQSGGRLVMNSVSLETEALVLRLYAEYGGELRRLSFESASRLGTMTSFRPALPVVQWRVDKP